MYKRLCIDSKNITVSVNSLKKLNSMISIRNTIMDIFGKESAVKLKHYKNKEFNDPLAIITMKNKHNQKVWYIYITLLK